MSPVAIILGVIIIILIYVLYRYFTSTATTLQSSLTDLNNQVNVIKNIGSPTNTQYAYGVWVYVNSWENKTPKVFMSQTDVLNVYLLQDKPSLCVDVKMSDTSTVSTIITQNFPLQKWVYIIVSLDNQFLDVYLDGKLVKSVRLSNAAGSIFPAVPGKSPQVWLGNSNVSNKLFNGVSAMTLSSTGSSLNTFTPFNAYATYFYRWTVPMDPGTAWRYYMKGNGQNSLMNNLSGYGVSMQILQNNVVASSYTLL
jgi:hypothetical protein